MNGSLPDVFLYEDTIFHYTSRAIAMENILNDMKFKFSIFQKANDPYEYGLRFWGITGPGSNEKNENKKLAKHTSRVFDYASKFLLRNTAYLAFCRNGESSNLDDLGCSKLRMWSQYGEDHRGVCLAFSREQLVIELIRMFERKSSRILYANMRYEKKMDEAFHDLSINLPEKFAYASVPRDEVFEDVGKRGNSFLFVKHNDYRDENEFRVVLLRKYHRKTDIFFDIKLSLKGIILGDRFPEVYQPTIKNLCSEMNFPFGKLNWKFGKWSFENWS